MDKNLMPVLFLDIDDVLCLNHTYGGLDVLDALYERHASPEAVFRNVFSAHACEALAQLHHAMQGRLWYVISSTWREWFDRDDLGEVLRRAGLGFVASSLHPAWCTPVHGHQGERDRDIAHWLDQHLRGEPFAIVDDTFSGPTLKPALMYPSHPFAGRVVLCQECVGLLPEHIEPLLSALRRPVGSQPGDLTPLALRDI